MHADFPRGARFAVAFLTAEAVGGLVFWALLLWRPGTVGALAPAGVSPEHARGLALADLPLLVGAATAAARGLARGRFWASSILTLHAGAMAYAGLAIWGLAIAAGGPFWAALLVTPSMTVPLWLAITLRPERPH